MKLKNNKLFLLLMAFAFLSNFGFAQSNEIEVVFMGNCGLYFTDGTTHIYTDFPYKSGAYKYMEYDESELDDLKDNAIFIFTHKHADHYSKKLLKRVMKEKGGQKFGVSNIAELSELEDLVDDFTIEAFKTEHKFFGIPFRHYSYLINWHGKRIYLSGDTTNPETIGKIKNIDWAFVPYWILKNAKDQNIEIDAKRYGVYHLYPAQIPSAKENWDQTDNIRPMVEQGELIRIKR